MATILGMWNGDPTESLPRLLTETYRGHVLGVPTGERDGAAYPGAIAGYRQAFPGVGFHVVDQLETGDRLVTRLEARRAGEASGLGSVSHGMNISRFDARGRLDEEWAVWSAWQDVAQEVPT